MDSHDNAEIYVYEKLMDIKQNGYDKIESIYVGTDFYIELVKTFSRKKYFVLYSLFSDTLKNSYNPVSIHISSIPVYLEESLIGKEVVFKVHKGYDYVKYEDIKEE